ncbi:MAG TPA: TIGR03086 family metal-binding protein [Mycobacterium sp.]|uniref:TIGR03086 family metal-binding protein n=1 Tax=Mycobacterium sp. TaxID=1785 RepID=UPI002D741367|nr:TIGR03086 family metal-binding protein [Mycobacterium sp.]HZU47329.1 TIGR03086 family metal-binding protein [Mycobacterium sp.]
MPSDLRPGPDSPPTDELDSAEEALGVLQRVLHRIPRDDLSRPTPCSEFDVAKLTDHLLNSITTIGGVVGAEFAPRQADDSVERQVVAAARPALDAWHRHGLQGTVKLGANEAPARVFAGVLAIEFLVHAWDYAKATGYDVDVADSLAEYVLELAHKIITPQGRSKVGFDEPVEVPGDASPLDRLIAFTGRRPAGYA